MCLPEKILPYTVEAYQQHYGDEFMGGFTHASLAKGQIDTKQCLTLVGKLNVGAKRVMPCISFNPAMLRGAQLEGGACSAVAFRVAKEALRLQKCLIDKQHIKNSRKEMSFALQLSRFIGDLEKGATSKRAADKVLQTTIRTEQAAFNTITVDREVISSGNAVSKKVGAMAPFYGLKVVESSPELRVRENEHLEAELLEQFQSLKPGVYFLRIIQEKYNHKLEKKGHSVVYIKTDDAEYNFDPALGVYTLLSEASKRHLMYSALLSAHQRFGVDVLSFHRLEEEVPISSTPFDVPELQLKGTIDSPCSPIGDRPVVIFSPGLGVPIHAYEAMAKGLCEKGLIVMSIDHLNTGLGTPRLEESEIIERALQNGEHLQKLTQLVRDAFFEKIPAHAPLAVMGHSIGGSASIEACRKTSEILAAINMDGRIIDPTAVSQPVLQLIATRAKEDRSLYHAALSALGTSNPHLSLVEVDAKHGDFSSPQPDFLSFMIDRCADFLHRHLRKGDES